MPNENVDSALKRMKGKISSKPQAEVADCWGNSDGKFSCFLFIIRRGVGRRRRCMQLKVNKGVETLIKTHHGNDARKKRGEG